MSHWWWVFPSAAAASFVLTGCLLKIALAQGLLDSPNSRSAHAVPTPRLGGLAIAIPFLLGVAMLAAMGHLQAGAVIAFLAPGSLVAAIGLLDDRHSVAPRWRLFVHFGAAAGALILLGGFPQISMKVASMSLDLGLLGHLLSAIYLVWLLNLYNFMDGIDGLAGLEAVTVGIGASSIYLSLAQYAVPASLTLLLASSVIGFLVWNWPPAKIFMGDAGSGFLGITIGILTIQGAWFGAEFFFGWLILLGVFIVDSTFTLLKRAIGGEKIFEAHNSHAYQNAVRLVGSHKRVTVTIGIINVFWLLPLAFLVCHAYLDGLLGLLIAYAPLVLLAVRFKAGATNLPSTAIKALRPRTP